MNFELLSLLLDILVLLFLGVTIYVAVRLSKSLNAFRKGRRQMGDMLEKLGRNIDQANAAIINLRATSSKSADQLKELIDEARELSQELQIMTDSADKLARRLDKSIGQGRGGGTAPGKTAAARPDDRADSFFIQDRDFGDEPPAGAEEWEEEETPIPENLQSKAERELYRALQRGPKKRPATSSGGRH